MMNLKIQKLGKYELVERLGRGGMAEVFKGFQPSIERFVAIKIMHKHLAAEEQFVERFCSEAKGIAQLRHHNIVRIIDFDIQDDLYYMVLDYIEGQTLRGYLKKNKMFEPTQALCILAQLADALAYAHAQGIIHRDIKPGNIMFMDDSLFSPVLTDFGLARILADDGMTMTGALIGTPAYMSPEALRGEKVDLRSDIYSLGVVLYEMLVGRTPYTADSPYGMILKQLHDPLPSPRELNPDLPEIVEELILKAMAKELPERFQSAEEFSLAIHETFSILTDGQNMICPLNRTLPPRKHSLKWRKAKAKRSSMIRIMSLAGSFGASLLIALLMLQLLVGAGDKKSAVTASQEEQNLAALANPAATVASAEDGFTPPSSEVNDETSRQVGKPHLSPGATPTIVVVPSSLRRKDTSNQTVRPTMTSIPSEASGASSTPIEHSTGEKESASSSAISTEAPATISTPIEHSTGEKESASSSAILTEEPAPTLTAGVIAISMPIEQELVEKEPNVPSVIPSQAPSATSIPSQAPSATRIPSQAPAVTSIPSQAPSATSIPSQAPAATSIPSQAPSATSIPTQAPSATSIPSQAPAATSIPSQAPAATSIPTLAPSATSIPSQAPAATTMPSQAPAATTMPSQAPAATTMPTQAPSATTMPSQAPAATTIPTQAPSKPTEEPNLPKPTNEDREEIVDNPANQGENTSDHNSNNNDNNNNQEDNQQNNKGDGEQGNTGNDKQQGNEQQNNSQEDKKEDNQANDKPSDEQQNNSQEDKKEDNQPSDKANDKPSDEQQNNNQAG